MEYVVDFARYVSDTGSQHVLPSRLHDYTLCKRTQCQVGPMPDMTILLMRCDLLFVHQARVLRGLVVHSAWHHLGSSVSEPPEDQALRLPALRVAGQLPM